MAEVLLNRNVPLIDEVAELIEQGGGPSLTSILDALRESMALQPGGLTEGQRNAAEQTAIRREILNYRVQYEEPAAAALRRRKIESPRSAAALTKLGNGIADKAFLDALDLDFSRLTLWPNVSSLSLRVSPELSADKFACCAFIARADHNIIVLYVGPYRPCLHGSGFYLIYDAHLKTLAAAPQLPKSISLFSHCCIGSGAAVLRISPPTGYMVAELLLRLGSKGLPTSNATLVTWSNCFSSSLPPRWIETEVVLPQLPYPLVNGYSFHADTVFPVGRSCLCWADLTMGIIVCKDLLAQDLEFTFVPLPEGLSCDPLHGHGRGCPEERRCMSCSTCDNTVIRFVCLENRILTRWTFDLSDVKSGWKEVMSFDIPSRVPVPPESWVSCPLLSVAEDGVVYVDINNRRTPGYRVAFYNDHILTVAPQSERVTHKIVTSSSCFYMTSAVRE